MMKEKAAGLTLPPSPLSILVSSSRSRRVLTFGNRLLQNLEMPHARAFLPLSIVTEVSSLKVHSPEAAHRARVRKNARSLRRPSRVVSTWPPRGLKRLAPWKVSVHIRKRRRRALLALARPSVLIAARFWRRVTEMCARCGACRRGALCLEKTWESPRKRSEACSLARTDAAYNNLAFRLPSAGWPSSAPTVQWRLRNCIGRRPPASEGGEKKAWYYRSSYCRAATLGLRKCFWKGANSFYYIFLGLIYLYDIYVIWCYSIRFWVGCLLQ